MTCITSLKRQFYFVSMRWRKSRRKKSINLKGQKKKQGRATCGFFNLCSVEKLGHLVLIGYVILLDHRRNERLSNNHIAFQAVVYLAGLLFTSHRHRCSVQFSLLHAHNIEDIYPAIFSRSVQRHICRGCFYFESNNDADPIQRL